MIEMEGPTHPPFGQCLSLEMRDVELDQLRYEECCGAPSGPSSVLFCMHCTVEGSVNRRMGQLRGPPKAPALIAEDIGNGLIGNISAARADRIDCAEYRRTPRTRLGLAGTGTHRTSGRGQWRATSSRKQSVLGMGRRSSRRQQDTLEAPLQHIKRFAQAERMHLGPGPRIELEYKLLEVVQNELSESSVKAIFQAVTLVDKMG